MNKEVVHTYNRLLFSHKNKNLLLATMDDLESIMLNEKSQRKKYELTCMWNPRNITNEQTKQNRLIDRSDWVVVAIGEELGEWVK